MDFKVYQKETVKQPQGNIEVLKTGIIDIYPKFSEDNELSLIGADLVEGKEEIMQACSLSTIYQRGLDPVDLDDGIEWGEAIRGEVTPPQIIAQVQAAVSDVSNTAEVNFYTVRDKNGVEKLAFELRAI